MKSLTRHALSGLAALLFAVVATDADAQLSLVWTVPGVIDNGAMKTYVACTTDT